MNKIQKILAGILLVALVLSLHGIYRFTEIGRDDGFSPGDFLTVDAESPPPPDSSDLPETNFALRFLSQEEQRELQFELAVDLNTADLEELQRLHRVGESTARNIIRHRETHGPFRSENDVLDVSGIGPTTLDGFRGEARIGDTLIE